MRSLSKKIGRFQIPGLSLRVQILFGVVFVITWGYFVVANSISLCVVVVGGIALLAQSVALNFQWYKSRRHLVEEVTEENGGLRIKKRGRTILIEEKCISSLTFIRGNPSLVTLQLSKDTPLGTIVQFIPDAPIEKGLSGIIDTGALIGFLFRKEEP